MTTCLTCAVQDKPKTVVKVVPVAETPLATPVETVLVPLTTTVPAVAVSGNAARLFLLTRVFTACHHSSL